MPTIERKGKVSRTVIGSLEALNFKTTSLPIFDAVGKPIEGYQRIYRPDTGATLSVMTKQYQLVEHQEAILPAVEVLGKEGWKVRASRVERQGASAYVELERRDTATKIVGEKVGERILMRNTYDGTSSLRLSFGAIVLACSNGAVIPGAGIGFDAHHMGDIRDRLGALTSRVRQIEQGLGERMVETYRHLDAPVPSEIGREIVKRILGERKIELPLRYWRQGLGRTGDLTAWNLYNGITQYLTHDFTGGWGRRERKNSEALALIDRYIAQGTLPSLKPEDN